MTVGLLELLWHATAEFAPQGDIGRFDDRGIAKLIGWRGNPGRLVAALVEARWLDPDPTHRLLIHDWPAHAPAYVKKRLERADMPYFYPAADNGRQGGGSCLPTLTKPYQDQALTKTKTSVAKKTATGFPIILDTPAFQRVWADWERHRREIHHALKPTTRQRQLKKLAKVAEASGVQEAVGMIEQSIEQGWQGLFAVKSKGAGDGRIRKGGRGANEMPYAGADQSIALKG